MLEFVVTLLIALFLMMPSTNRAYCNGMKRASFGIAACDNVVGIMLSIAMLGVVYFIANRYNGVVRMPRIIF